VPEVASIFSGVQIGAESTKGTGVAAGKLLNYLSLEPGIELEFNRFRPIGQLVASAITPGKDSTSWGVSGQGTYSEIVYPLCSLLTNVSPSTVDTSARLWDFIPLGRSEDTTKTYTIESGSATRAQKATFGQFTGLELTFNRTDGVAISGSAIGQQLQDNITLTPTPAAIEDKPILPTHLDVYIDTTSAGLGTTKLTRDFNAVFRCNDRFNSVWPINSANASFIDVVNTEPAVQMELAVAADTQGMAFLADARLGTTKYIRMQAEAPGASYGFAGAATATYHLKIDMAGKISNIAAFDDQDGLKVLTYTFDAIYDSAWGSGRYLRVQAQNKVAAL
jgi:hypothetical protein